MSEPEPARNEGRVIVGAIAAFGAYCAMYAVRKPFTAGTFDGLAIGPVDYKTLLLIAQTIGYALSKLIGIRIIAEFGRRGRAAAILLLIAAAWGALMLFAVIPSPWNIACLFLNGLPLGMIWGLVFSYLEGRRSSDLLGAILCASFILGSAGARSAAVTVLNAGVGTYWMPAATGLVFAPLLMLCVALLERMPPPSAADEAARTPRTPMSRSARLAFLRDYGFAMILLVIGYVLLTALRDFRDGFAIELWRDFGYRHEAAILTTTELPVAGITLAGLGALMLVRDNLRALLAMHAVVIGGALLLGGSTAAYDAGAIGPVAWMILSGAGLYLAYTPFNAMLFDRMIATIGHAGNAGFLIYIADSSGYAGSVALLLLRSFGTPHLRWARFYADASYATAMVVVLCTALSAIYFMRRMRRPGATAAA